MVPKRRTAGQKLKDKANKKVPSLPAASSSDEEHAVDNAKTSLAEKRKQVSFGWEIDEEEETKEQVGKKTKKAGGVASGRSIFATLPAVSDSESSSSSTVSDPTECPEEFLPKADPKAGVKRKASSSDDDEDDKVAPAKEQALKKAKAKSGGAGQSSSDDESSEPNAQATQGKPQLPVPASPAPGFDLNGSSQVLPKAKAKPKAKAETGTEGDGNSSDDDSEAGRDADVAKEDPEGEKKAIAQQKELLDQFRGRGTSPSPATAAAGTPPAQRREITRWLIDASLGLKTKPGKVLAGVNKRTRMELTALVDASTTDRLIKNGEVVVGKCVTAPDGSEWLLAGGYYLPMRVKDQPVVHPYHGVQPNSIRGSSDIGDAGRQADDSAQPSALELRILARKGTDQPSAEEPKNASASTSSTSPATRSPQLAAKSPSSASAVAPAAAGEGVSPGSLPPSTTEEATGETTAAGRTGRSPSPAPQDQGSRQPATAAAEPSSGSADAPAAPAPSAGPAAHRSDRAGSPAPARALSRSPSVARAFALQPADAQSPGLHAALARADAAKLERTQESAAFASGVASPAPSQRSARSTAQLPMGSQVVRADDAADDGSQPLPSPAETEVFDRPAQAQGLRPLQHSRPRRPAKSSNPSSAFMLAMLPQMLNWLPPERRGAVTEAAVFAACSSSLSQLWSDTFLTGGMPREEYDALRYRMVRLLCPDMDPVNILPPPG
eukprot:CAMPEP_0170574794 /NCGR_PEP_ID=MMETSP0224-20130122/3496_1 /TAXON_ID=285029 /ORGANISM="Togula jolla, Strain CCCM 725" /LENGTH=722 /DNA_ID=CAMNT_0010897487 /DNA_START=157 /DNA_END=2326 /DNA_ORIENTATION=+